MQVKRFKASKIHGYLNFNIHFRSDLTFLTGINGSGKTSVVQSIIALISPSFSVLANLEFASIEVEVFHDGKEILIRAVRQQDGSTKLSSPGVHETLSLRPFIADPDEPPYRSTEKELEYYRDLTGAVANHQLMQLINSLPTPMFLDLDRRARALQEYRSTTSARHRIPRRGRNIFSFFLSQSLNLAAELAETSYRENVIAVSRIGDELRRQLVLDLLVFDTSAELPLHFALPTRDELATLAAFKKSINDLPSILQIPQSEIDRRLVPSLNALEKFSSALPPGTKLQRLFDDGSANSEQLKAVVGWSSTRPQLNKLVKMVERLKDYTAKKEQLTEKINRYIEILNGFFRDSKKTVSFGTDGYLQFTMPPSETPKSVLALSSGEAQLFVIMTHLFFNPLAQEGNVFIVDEPELSLHIQWQELFVSSVISANPDVQYIMATHSPSIILEKTENCFDLSR